MTREEVRLFGKDCAIDKIVKYDWKLRDQPGEMAAINKNELKVDLAYQRPNSHRQVLSIASKWSWIAAGVLIVALRDDGYYIVDGAHRHAAACLRSDITDLPCLVFVSESLAYEADTFVVVNTNRKPVSAIGKYSARLAAQDPVACGLSSLLAQLGVTVTPCAANRGDLKAVGAVLDAYEKHPERCESVLRLCLDIPSESFIAKDLFDGLFYLAMKGVNLADRRFVGRACSLSAEQLVQAINKHKALVGFGGIPVCAAAILGAINKGLRNKIKLPLEMSGE